MNKFKNSRKMDALANIYRASFCLAKDDKQTAISFVKKSLPFFKTKDQRYLESVIKGKGTNKVTAEKLCDFYVRMKTY